MAGRVRLLTGGWRFWYNVGVRGTYTAHREGYTVDHIGSRDARQRFFELVRQAHGGRPAVVTIDGIPVAAIVGYETFKRYRTVEELSPSTVTDLERHALALAGQDPDKAALLLSEALTSLLSRQRERDDEQTTAK